MRGANAPSPRSPKPRRPGRRRLRCGRRGKRAVGPFRRTERPAPNGRRNPSSEPPHRIRRQPRRHRRTATQDSTGRPSCDSTTARNGIAAKRVPKPSASAKPRKSPFRLPNASPPKERNVKNRKRIEREEFISSLSHIGSMIAHSDYYYIILGHINILYGFI